MHLNYNAYSQIPIPTHSRLITVNPHMTIRLLILVLFREITSLQYEHYTKDI
jgi:hypothetical protein